jgi:hypothetical protein
VTARIAEVAGQHREVRGLCALIQIVCKQLEQEYSIPTQDGRQQLRWMVSRWVTLNLGRDRGGVSAKDDWAPAVDNNIDVAGLALTKEMFAGIVVVQTTPTGQGTSQAEVQDVSEDTAVKLTAFMNDMMVAVHRQQEANEVAIQRLRFDLEYVVTKTDAAIALSREETQAMVTRTKAEIDLLHAEVVAAKARQAASEAATVHSLSTTESVNARCRELELQMKLMEMKQASAAAGDGPPPWKRARTVAPGPAAAMPRHRGKRLSASHIVWADLVQEEADVERLDLETVFRTVHRWFKDRAGAPSKCPLDIEVLRADNDVPVVYVLPAECRRGLAERHRDALLRYVQRTLVPDTRATEEEPTENCADPGAVASAVEPAPCFVLARAVAGPPPSELQPPSLAQLWRTWRG